MRAFRGFVGSRVLVFLQSGTTVAGSLEDVNRDGLTLVGPSVVDEDGSEREAKGSLIVPTASIVFVQVVN